MSSPPLASYWSSRALRRACDLAAVLGEDRPQQALAITEVVLQRRRVALLGLAVDLAQRHAVDAAVGEELLGGGDQRRRRVGGLVPPFDALAMAGDHTDERRPDARTRCARSAGSSLLGQWPSATASSRRRRRRRSCRGGSCSASAVGGRLRVRVGVPAAGGRCSAPSSTRLGRRSRCRATRRRADRSTRSRSSEPWRHFVQGAQRPGGASHETVAATPAGPLHDRLADIAGRLDAGLAESWADRQARRRDRRRRQPPRPDPRCARSSARCRPRPATRRRADLAAAIDVGREPAGHAPTG